MQLTNDEKFLEIILFDGHSYLDVLDRNSNNNEFRRTSFKKFS